MEELQRVLEEELLEIGAEDEIDINLENGETSGEKRKFIPWNFPPKPSFRARKIIECLNEICRDSSPVGLVGPIVELQVGKCNGVDTADWIDIAFCLSWNGKRYAFEIDEEYHDMPEQKEKDRAKDKRLEKRGWKIKRFHHTECDQLGPKCIAIKIIGFMLDDDLGISKN